MDWGLFLTFLAACGAAAATGAMFEPGAWYDDLAKPRWTPPGWVFPVTWTLLYLFMSYAAMRVAGLPDSGQALAFWAMQIAVAATCAAFWQIDALAGALLLPYLLWVSIAFALNLSVLRRNPAYAT